MRQSCTISFFCNINRQTPVKYNLQYIQMFKIILDFLVIKLFHITMGI